MSESKAPTDAVPLAPGAGEASELPGLGSTVGFDVASDPPHAATIATRAKAVMTANQYLPEINLLEMRIAISVLHPQDIIGFYETGESHGCMQANAELTPWAPALDVPY